MKTNPILILLAFILRTSVSFSQIVWADAPAVTVLYRNCVNEILIENPDDCNWLPKVEMAEATVIPHKIYPHFFRVIPTGNNGRLTITLATNIQSHLKIRVLLILNL